MKGRASEGEDYSIARMGVPATAAAFRAEGLVKRFGARRALDGAGMEVAPGAAVGLAGATA